jgi:sensor histidine kinase YesM
MIGLQNVKKRLDIVYNDRYILNTTIEGNTYQINLTIQYAA